MAASLALPATSGGQANGPDAFKHLATWVDIYDPGAMNSKSINRMKNNGVQTIYVETANDRSSTFANRSGVARLLNYAHTRGIKVVAWTLPGHTNPSDDWKKAKAALNFKTGRGDFFDGFALDIESTKVRSIKTRNARMLALSEKIDRNTNRPLGAITFSPVFINGPWPDFPWKRVAQIYNVMMPMCYSSYHYSSEKEVRVYTQRCVNRLRNRTSQNKPIHMVGGIADKMGAGETRGFVHGVLNKNISGGSLYDYRTSSSSDWKYLKSIK